MGDLRFNLLLRFVFRLLKTSVFFSKLVLPSFESDTFLKASRCYPSVIHNAVEVVCITGLFFSFPAPFLIHFGFIMYSLFVAIFVLSSAALQDATIYENSKSTSG